MNTKAFSLWDRCQLEGVALDREVARLEGSLGALGAPAYSTDWALAGPIIERDHIFLDAPHTEHRNYGKSPETGNYVIPVWRATVSGATRERPNPSGSEIMPKTVGRGSGPTAIIAAMRAYCDSWVTSPDA